MAKKAAALKGGTGTTTVPAKTPPKTPGKKTAPAKAATPPAKTPPAKVHTGARSKLPASARLGEALDNPAPAPEKPQPATHIPLTVVKREVQYDKFSAKLRVGENALTGKDAQEFLGWQEEPDGSTFQDEYTLTDLYGKKVRCHNNSHNRPFDLSLARTYASEVLKGHWRFNGESMIIGETGETLAAQHRLIGLVLAFQEWKKHPDKWLHLWPTEPVMECLVVFGVQETDDVVNTIDTGRPRSLSDVLFRTSDVFSKIKKESERKAITRCAGYAIKQLWYRTGAGIDAFAAGKRTHSDSLDFLNRHPRLLECVDTIWTENGDEDRVGFYLSPGYAAALLYLMGCSATDPKAYSESDQPNEEMLDWSLADKAWDFWVCLTGADPEVSGPIREAMAKTADGSDNGVASLNERMGTLVKAWNLFVEDKKYTPQDLILDYGVDTRGNKRPAEVPVVGGIDMGIPKEESSDTTDSDDEIPTPQIKPGASPRKPADLPVGTKVLVRIPNTKEWIGEITCHESDVHGAHVMVKDDQGDEYKADLKHVTPA